MFSRIEIAQFITNILQHGEDHQEFLDKIRDKAKDLANYHMESGLYPTVVTMSELDPELAKLSDTASYNAVTTTLWGIVFVEAVRQKMIEELGDKVLH